MQLDFQALGFTKEELQQRVVDQIVQHALSSTFYDEDENEFTRDSKFARDVDAKIKEHINVTINNLAEKHVLPNVSKYIEGMVLQQTNTWGEKTGKPVTFVEYLMQRAEAYMQEKVDFQGKTKQEAGSYFNGTQTRIAHLMHEHLHYSIDSAMKDALKIATSAISTGIQETVKIKLGEISAGLKTEVKLK